MLKEKYLVKLILTHGKFTIKGNTTRGSTRTPYLRYFPKPTPEEASLPMSAPS